MMRVHLARLLLHRRVLLLSGLALGIGIAGYVAWERRPYTPLHAVSEQAAIVLSLSQGMASMNGVFRIKEQVRGKNPLLKQYETTVKKVMALLPPETGIWWASRPQAGAFSLHINDSLQPLIVLDAGENIAPERILSSASGAWSSYRFKGEIIYEYRGRERWTIAFKRNLLLVSRFSYLVEEALMQLRRRGRTWKRRAALTQAPVSVLARCAGLAEHIRPALVPEWSAIAEELLSPFEALVMGFWPDSSEVVIRASRTAFSGNALERYSISAILPDHVAFYTWHTRKPPEKALEDFARRGQNSEAFQRYVLPWCGQEAAFIWLEPQANNLTFEGAWVCSVRDERLAYQLLEAYGARSGMIRRYRYHAFEIRQFLDRSLIEPFLWPGIKIRPENPACAIFNGYAVFAPSATALELWLDKYIVNQTLANEPDYLALLSRQSSQSQWSVFFHGRAMALLMQKLLTPEADEWLLALGPSISQYLIGLDFQPKGRGVWRAELEQVRIRPQATTAIRLGWKISLPARAIGEPQGIAPSKAEPTALVLAQDARGHLHCIEAGGHLRWSKALDLPIRSRIHALEEQSAEQRYYVFNTSNALWLLDANGQQGLGFPLRFQSPITNGVIAVPLESARRYGLFVACANGNVYGFDAYGRPLQGWNPKVSGIGRVVHPLLHFQWENKDYIVALGEKGQLICADRAGKDHFAPLQLEGNFTTTPPLCLWEKNAPYILCINDEGVAFRCSTSGQVSSYPCGGRARQRCLGAIMPAPPRTGRASVVVASGTVLRPCPSLRGSQHSARPFEVDLRAPIDTLWTADNIGLGVLCRSRREAFLVYPDGRVAKGFPIGSDTPFDLFAVGPREYWMVVGYDTEIYAYRLEQR
ncbi:MAG: DUF3352 domain-containing protein [Saprospiraceae bacterium]|nr:DUF3352 domain-containing protein [Saprospiraceae bacterium]MDW8484730.1 hypothetical protein [Saprospiraceae bacterium]